MPIIGRRTELLPLVVSTANLWGVSPALVDAIVVVESTYQPYVSRYEAGYKWITKVPEFAGIYKTSVEFEEECQKTSWGLCQVMGGTARDLGFNGQISTLLDPQINLDLGCKLLSKLLKRYGNEPDAIASYNAGSPKKTTEGLYKNQDYVDKVLKTMARLKA